MSKTFFGYKLNRFEETLIWGFLGVVVLLPVFGAMISSFLPKPCSELKEDRNFAIYRFQEEAKKYPILPNDPDFYLDAARWGKIGDIREPGVFQLLGYARKIEEAESKMGECRT